MAYRSVREGKIIQHFKDRNGYDAEREIPSARVTCAKCGWSMVVVAGSKTPGRCLCGGDLR